MVVANKAAQAGLAQRLTRRSPERGEMRWLLAVAAAFLVVHIVAMVIWGRASASETTAPVQATISPLCD
jgi:hypothetical protein